MSKFSGVYCIRNKISGKRYVGSSKEVLGRWKMHQGELRLNKHHCNHLQRAWNKYGEEAFVFEVLERCSPERCITREQHWLDFWSKDVLYNVSPTAGSPLGIKRSTAYKRMLSKTRMGHPVSKSTREKLRKAHKGVKKPPRSPEYCQNISKAKMGHGVSQATRKKLSKAVKKLWASGAYEEVQRVISESAKRRISGKIKAHWKNGTYNKKIGRTS